MKMNVESLERSLSAALANLTAGLGELDRLDATVSLNAFTRRMLDLEPATHHRFVNRKLEAVARLADDLPLFAAAGETGAEAAPAPDPLADALGAINPDALSPKDALELIYRLKDLMKE